MSLEPNRTVFRCTLHYPEDDWLKDEACGKNYK